MPKKLRSSAVAMALLVSSIVASAAGGGYKISAGGAGGDGGKIDSVADLKRWDEANLKTGEAVGRRAVERSGRHEREESPADVKRADEAKVKAVLAAQAAERNRKAEIAEKAKKLIEAQPRSVAKDTLTFILDQAQGIGIGKVLEFAAGKIVGGVLSLAVDLATPSNSMDPVDPYDLPKTKEDMRALRSFLEEYERAEKAKTPTATPQPLDKDNSIDPSFDGLRNPAGLAEVQLKRAVISAVKLRNADAGYVVETVIEKSMPGSPIKLDDATLEKIADTFRQQLPPNICFIARRDICTLNVGKQGDACMCPKLTFDGYDLRSWARGVAGVRPMSGVCDSPVGKCNMASSGPVGTPCVCIPNFPVPGPMPIGKIVEQ